MIRGGVHTGRNVVIVFLTMTAMTSIMKLTTMPCNDGLDGQLGITAKYFQKSGNNEAMYIQYDIKILINELSK